MRVVGREEFAAARRSRQDAAIEELLPYVRRALSHYEDREEWWRPLVARTRTVFYAVVAEDSGDPDLRDLGTWRRLARLIRETLSRTGEPDEHTARAIAVWLSTAAINAAAVVAAKADPEELVLVWVTMHDNAVRATHREADGQVRPVGEKFSVGGAEMAFPGDPSVDIALWINCRCALRPDVISVTEPAGLAMSAQDGDDEYELEPEESVMTTSVREPEVLAQQESGVPWHGVLAPEGKWSGDGRRFSEEALTHRDLPLPLTWQKISDDGHKGSVVVAKIERIARVDGEMRGEGHYLTTAEADEALGLVADFGRFGVSVDADDAEFELDDDDSGKITFTRARISSASQVPIPAFAEAFISLGDSPDGFMPPAEECDPSSPEYEECLAHARPSAGLETEAFVSEKSWDGSAGRFTPEQWKKSCILHVCDGLEKSCHKLPIREPGGALSRAGVHAAASRFNQVDAPSDAKSRAKSALRGAYRQLGEEVPDALKADADAEEFADIEQFVDVAPGRTEDGPGWLTHPVDTDRLRDYWVHGPGAAKINWGAPGDFDRCRANLAEYVKPQHLNGYCANRHYDATGFWPGRAPSEGGSADADSFNDEVAAPALGLVADAGWCAPSEWFKDPELRELTPLTVTDDGRVFGHLAGWTTCHIGEQYKGMCVTPPQSSTDYAYFMAGQVLTDAGPVNVGSLTMDTGHAGPGRMRPALAHYDNTGTVVADIAVGEDEFGIWMAGACRPDVTPEKVAALRAAKMSGDWREVRGELELIAALATNTSGFPIPRPRVGIAAGVQESLVAAGMVEVDEPLSKTVHALTDMVIEEMSARERRRERVAELARRVRGESDGL